MNQEILVERLFETLISGDRVAARTIIEEAAQQGASPELIVSELIWPTYEMVEKLYRNDQLMTLSHHMATRLLRMLCDQVAADYSAQPSQGRTVFAVCGPNEPDELAAQMAVDLIERNGFEVRFAGGGIANDEILEHVNNNTPDVLLMFASAASDLPNIRELIDTIHEIGACDSMQIVVGGGVFNRAEGLAEEIGADLWAQTPTELAYEMIEQPERRASAEQRTVGRKRRVRSAA